MAKLGVENRASMPPQPEHNIPHDALLTREFVRKLPGYSENPKSMLIGYRNEVAQMGPGPNWSGKSTHEGKQVDIKVWDHENTNDITLRVKLSDREDSWRIRMGEARNGKSFTYISFEREWSRVPVFPLNPESEWGFIPEAEERVNRFSEKSVKYALKEDVSGVGNDRILREEDIDNAPQAYPLSRWSRENNIYKTIAAIKNLMLKATPVES
jgi:hypothetical protein